MPMIHGYTPRLKNVFEWLDEHYPEMDVRVEHTTLCDQVSYGDDCVGACPVIDDFETDDCPEHGEQKVVGESSTQGADPYAVNHLACGHWVACFGPGEPNVIVRSKR